MADSHVVWLYSKLYNVVTPTYPFVNTLLKRYERPNGQLSAGTLNPIGLNDYEGAAQQLPFAHSNDADVYIITDSYCVKTDVFLTSHTFEYWQSYWDSTYRKEGVAQLQFGSKSKTNNSGYLTDLNGNNISGTTADIYAHQYAEFELYTDNTFSEFTSLGQYIHDNIALIGNTDGLDTTAKYTIFNYNNTICLGVGVGKCSISTKRYGNRYIIYTGSFPFDRNNALPYAVPYTSPCYRVQPTLTFDSVDPDAHNYGTQLNGYISQNSLPYPRVVTNNEFNNLVGENVIGSNDPLEDAGYSSANDPSTPIQPGDDNPGGDGTFQLQDNDIPESPLPPASSSIIGAGCGTVYCDTGLNIRSLMSYMWTHADDIINNLKKIIANPIDAILGLHIVPVVPTVGTSQQVYLGNVGTSVNMTPVTNPYLRYRLGTININKYWGSALDFNPFTQFNIHLPYIGFRQLNTDDLMGSDVELYYDIDVISGACVAHLKVTRTDPLTKETHTVDQYEWAGNCAMQIPVTSTNYQSLYSGVFNAILTVGAAIATGAAGMLGGTMTGAEAALGIGQSLSTSANHMLNGGSKTRVERSGSIGGTHGFLGSQWAFIERITPRQSLASVYKEVLGYPSNTTQVLGTCTGFTQIENINLENFSCTADEKNELEKLLKGGVIF